MASVLVTRPQPAAQETVARVRALGHTAWAAPLMRIAPLRTALPAAAHIDAVVVASRHAVDAVPDAFAQTKMFAVGDTTARHARARFADVTSADGDAHALSALIAAHRTALGRGRLLLAAARLEGHALSQALRQDNFTVYRRAVYAQRPVNRLPSQAKEALDGGGLTHALFFSARTAAIFARLFAASHADRECLQRITAVTIGPAAAMALEALPWRSLRVAAQPTQEEMLALLS